MNAFLFLLYINSYLMDILRKRDDFKLVLDEVNKVYLMVHLDNDTEMIQAFRCCFCIVYVLQ